jgi:DtxR family Mn-dependent transcriptional regulator
MIGSSERHPAFEEYCEAIYEMHEDDMDVIRARIADRLNVSRASVSQMIDRLTKAGLVATDSNCITLTETGEELAQRVVRRHRLAERFLTDILGLSWADAHLEAGKWEHVMSDEVEAAMNRLLGAPTTCPHGNPIPGSSYITPSTVPLAAVTPGSKFTVSRIPEELEVTPGVLDFLQHASLLPGRSGNVTSSRGDGSVSVEIAGQAVDVDAFASARILVTA